MRAINFICLALLFLVTGCKDKRYMNYYGNKPVYMDYDEFRNSVKLENAHALKEKGAFFLHNSTLYVIEKNQGFHIFDNSNPASPVNVGFVRVYGASNFSMKENTMYINSYIDLVVLDCSNPEHPSQINRIKDVFEYSVDYPNNGYRTQHVDKNKGVVLSFELTDIKEEKPDNQSSVYLTAMEGDGAFTINSVGGGGNVSGSISTFTSNSHHLYILSFNSLMSFGISDASYPVKQSTTSLNRWAETLLADETHLFIGTTTGMMIYNAPGNGDPAYTSEITHIQACDPVAIDGDFAYYTIRSGTNCGNSSNKLEVVDISNLSSPFLVGSFDLTNPHGLSAQDNKVWVCDNSSGVRCFNSSTPSTTGNLQLSQFTGVTAYDIIVSGQNAIVMGENGLIQLDYSNANSPSIISTINF